MGGVGKGHAGEGAGREERGKIGQVILEREGIKYKKGGSERCIKVGTQGAYRDWAEIKQTEGDSIGRANYKRTGSEAESLKKGGC